MVNVQLGDVATWYNVHGDGEPLVLLHGGFVDSRMFQPALPMLVDRFHAYRVDRRGHGHTPDVDGPMTYDGMADDMIAFLEKVVGEAAHLVGHSDGANVALMVALKRPDLVRKLVLISGNFHHEGMLPGVLDGFDSPETIEFLGSRYGEVSPDGEDHYPVVVAKIIEMGRTQPTLTSADLAGVRARTLVVSGDDDAIALEHTLELYRGIPDSELAVVPGTSHLLVMEKPERVYPLIADFLLNDPVPTRQPIRRA
ncbi:alpha/beta fold hydrolase [Nocardia huaxiensis]|uniref:Alpha/beta hydrolase n=1 Tax=Nocardia huaxiensis TaxID=2755382 RepID=A0A7D6VF38_9NOCA|nr:alpha/beta hydrolase [Nocardia huaxiensis]QLY31175.1 alpha/beta hydrolase [Nocardia huaxiensis]UFS94704.1 alpha/beta hydrolase [Nocardia huaxiensis]